MLRCGIILQVPEFVVKFPLRRLFRNDNACLYAVYALRIIRSNFNDPMGSLKSWDNGDPCTSNWTGVICATSNDEYLHIERLYNRHFKNYFYGSYFYIFKYDNHTFIFNFKFRLFSILFLKHSFWIY